MGQPGPLSTPTHLSHSLCSHVTLSLQGLPLNQYLKSKLQIPPDLGGK